MRMLSSTVPSKSTALLEHKRDLRAERLARDSCDVRPVDEHATGLWTEKARDQVRKGGLSRSSRTYECGHLSHACFAIHALEHGLPVVVREVHVLDLYPFANRCKRTCVRGYPLQPQDPSEKTHGEGRPRTLAMNPQGAEIGGVDEH